MACVSLYVFLWIPVLGNIERQVTKVRSMILLIPLEICAGVKNIRLLVLSYFITGAENEWIKEGNNNGHYLLINKKYILNNINFYIIFLINN